MDKEALALEKKISELPFEVEIITGTFTEGNGICVSNDDFVRIVKEARHFIIFKVCRGNGYNSNWTSYAASYQSQLITTSTTPYALNNQEVKEE